MIFLKQRNEKFEQQMMQSGSEELIERISRALPEDGTLEAFPGFFLFRLSSVTKERFSVAVPAFCIIAQGSKEALFGEEVYRYDPGHYLISTVELPTRTRIVERPKKSLISV